jgi:hypothetical protein
MRARFEEMRFSSGEDLDTEDEAELDHKDIESSSVLWKELLAARSNLVMETDPPHE